MLIDRLRKQQTSNNNRCPGETNCADFESAAGANREEKEIEACTACPKFPTKNRVIESAEIFAAVNRIVRLRNELRAGEPLDLHTISPLEREGVIRFLEIEAALEDEFKADFGEFIEFLQAKTSAGA
jgi:hypothetical protein